jgi:hypothetical protein
MLPQQVPRVINDAIRRTIAERQRHEPLSARPLGMKAMAYPRALRQRNRTTAPNTHSMVNPVCDCSPGR